MPYRHAGRSIWTNAHADAGHTRAIVAQPVERTPRVRWRADLDPALRARRRADRGGSSSLPRDWRPAPGWIVATRERIFVPAPDGAVTTLDSDSGALLEAAPLSSPESSLIVDAAGRLVGREPPEPFIAEMRDEAGQVLQGPAGMRVLDSAGRVLWEAREAAGSRAALALGRDAVVVAELRPFYHADYSHLLTLRREDGVELASLGATWHGVALCSHVLYWPPNGGGVVASTLDGATLWRMEARELDIPADMEVTLAATEGRVYAFCPATRSVACLG